MKAWTVIVLAVVAICLGCEAPDPAADRLAVGTEVIACPAVGFPDDTSIVLEKLPSGVSVQGGWDVIPIGTKLRVIADEAERPLDADDRVHPLRPVKVFVLEGEHKDRSGVVGRNYLRPVPR